MGKKKNGKDSKNDDESQESIQSIKNSSKKNSKIKDVTPIVAPIDDKKLVDKYFKDRSKYRIYPDNNNVFNGKYFYCTLHNIEKNSNKFYVIQLLENESTHKFVLFTRWGRIGAEGQKKKETVDSSSGPKLFMKKYEDKIKGGYKEVFEDDNKEEEEPSEEVKDKEELIKKIVELYKKKTGKPCYIYEESVVDNLGILDDKMGGNPYLPKDVPYPKNSKGENMGLILQVNLSKYKLDGFPQKGIFEMFHEIDPFGDGVDGEYKFFLFDENLEYQTKFPEINYDGFYINKPVKLTFKQGISYMSQNDNDFESIALKCINEITKKKYKDIEEFYNVYQIEDYFEDFENKFTGEGFEEGGLGVYPTFIQYDSREGSTKDYVNIFGFNSSENAFFNECSAAFILIDKNDLKKGKVEKAIFEYQQT